MIEKHAEIFLPPKIAHFLRSFGGERASTKACWLKPEDTRARAERITVSWLTASAQQFQLFQPIDGSWDDPIFDGFVSAP